MKSYKKKNKSSKFPLSLIKLNCLKFNKKLLKIKISNLLWNNSMKIYWRKNLNNNLRSNLKSKIKNSKKMNSKSLKCNLITQELNKITIKILEKILTSNSKSLIPNFMRLNLLLKNKEKPSKNYKSKRPFKIKNSIKSKKSTHQCHNSQKRNKNNLNHWDRKFKSNKWNKLILERYLKEYNKK